MLGHGKWLRIAKEDLAVAKVLLKLEHFSSVTFHCQQCAEKSLKGYLVFNVQEVPETYDLTKLVVLCKKIDSRWL